MPRRRHGQRFTSREQQFLAEYLGDCDGNATQAALAAGYSPHSAQRIGSQVLARPAIRAAVEREWAKREAERVAAHQAAMAQFDAELAAIRLRRQARQRAPTAER